MKNILSFSLGPIGASLCSLALFPVLAWYFPADDLGRLSMIQLIMTFTPMMFTLGLDQACVREYSGIENKGILFKTAIIPVLTGFIIVMILAIPLSPQLSKLVFEIKSLTLGYFILLSMAYALISRFLFLFLRMNNKGIFFSICQLSQKLFFLVIISIIILLHLENSFFNIIISNVISLILTLIMLMVFNVDIVREVVKSKVDVNLLKRMVRYGAPLTIGSIAFWGLISLDKIMIRSFSNYHELGIYSMSTNFAGIGLIIQSVFTTIWSPLVFKWEAKSNELAYSNIIKFINYMLFLIFSIFCLVGMFSGVLDWFLPKEYNSVKWIVISCIGYPLFYTLSEATYIGIAISKKTKYVMYSSFISLLANCLICYFLVGELGARGAAISTMLSFYIFLILRTEFSNFCWKKIERTKMYLTCLLLVILSALSTLYGDTFPLLIRLSWSICFICTLIINRKVIYNILSDIGFSKKERTR